MVIAFFVSAIPAAATQCEPNVDCIGTRQADKLYGTEHGDRIVARAGDDDVFGRRGRDRVNGGKGADHLDGGDAGDLLRGNGGDDVVIAGGQLDPDGGPTDYLLGGVGDDEIRSDGEDSLEGGRGNDTLYGTKFSQRLYGGRGDDTMYGKNAIDFYYLESPRAPDWWGHDVIVDGEGEPNYLYLPDDVKIDPPDVRVNLVASPNRPEVKVIGGRGTVNWRGNSILQLTDGRGDDVIRGNAERNRVWLYWGKDTVFARGGNDSISVHGERENVPDTINCGPGYDRVFLSAEDDVAPNCEYVYIRPE